MFDIVYEITMQVLFLVAFGQAVFVRRFDADEYGIEIQL